MNVVPALLVDRAVFFPRAFVKKILPPGAIFNFKIHKNVFAAGAKDPTGGGGTTELSRPLSWFSVSRFAAGEGERGEEKEEKEEQGRGIAFIHFFFTI